MAKVYCPGYFTGKVLQLPFDPQIPYHPKQFAIYGMCACLRVCSKYVVMLVWNVGDSETLKLQIISLS